MFLFSLKKLGSAFCECDEILIKCNGFLRRRRKENSHTWRKGNHFQHFLFVRCRSSVMVTEREQAGVMTTDLSLMGRIRKTGMYVRDHISFLFKYTITMHKSFTAHTKRSHRQNQMSNTKELIPYLLGT